MTEHPNISDVMAGWDLPRSRIRMKAAQDPAEAAHAIIDLRAEVERLRTELLEAQSHVGRANAREGYVRKLEAEVKRLREDYAKLRDALEHVSESEDRLRAEVERLRVFEAAFAKVPQEQQARIMAAVRAEMAETPSSDITAQREES